MNETTWLTLVVKNPILLQRSNKVFLSFHNFGVEMFVLQLLSPVSKKINDVSGL